MTPNTLFGFFEDQKMEQQSRSHRFVRQHCSICDKTMESWQELPISNVILCDECFFKRPADVCFHCGFTCNHKMIRLDDEHVDVFDEDEAILSDEFFQVDYEL
jgi:hypothetical protein